MERRAFIRFRAEIGFPREIPRDYKMKSVTLYRS